MNKEEIKKKIDELVNANISKIEEEVATINDDVPIFDKKDYKTKEGYPVYFDIDEYGRSSGAIALITVNTLPVLINTKLKYLAPYGWTEVIHDDGFFEQCHIIAYSLSAKFGNRKNVFIGTEHLNVKLMGDIEKSICSQVSKKKDKILYRVTMKYKDENQIPTGIFIEAQSLNYEDFHKCVFCYNVQSNVEFNYKDGTIIRDNRSEKEIEKTKERQCKNTEFNSINMEDVAPPKRTGKIRDFIINKRTKVYHLRGETEECYSIKNVDAKYLSETTISKSIVDNNYKACKKCNN